MTSPVVICEHAVPWWPGRKWSFQLDGRTADNMIMGHGSKRGAPAVVGSTLRAVPATMPDPFLNNADYGSTVYTPV